MMCMINGTVTGFKNWSLTVSSWLNDPKMELKALKAEKTERGGFEDFESPRI